MMIYDSRGGKSESESADPDQRFCQCFCHFSGMPYSRTSEGPKIHAPHSDFKLAAHHSITSYPDVPACPIVVALLQRCQVVEIRVAPVSPENGGSTFLVPGPKVSTEPSRHA
jgi:hypothetical protein